jgi:hypothetical protein
MTTYTDPFGGSTIQPSQVSYQAIALSANIVLSWPEDSSDASTDPIFARLTDVTPSGGGFSIQLPDARRVSSGYDGFFSNLGASSYTIRNAAGNTIATVAAGEVRYIYLQSNATLAGTWRSFNMGSLTSSNDAASLAGAGLEASGAQLRVSSASTLVSVDTAVGAADRAKAFVWTGGAGTLTFAAVASLTSTWCVSVTNQGSGVLTLVGTGGQLIDGAASITLNPGESCFVFSGATALYTVGRGRSILFNISLLSKAVTGGSVTLSTSEASSVAQKYSGVLTSDCTVTLPAVVQVYYVTNITTGAFTLTFRSPGVGATVVVPQGQSAVLLCDGTNVFNMSGGGAFAYSGLITRAPKTSTYQLVNADFGRLIDCTSGTFSVTTLSAAVLGAGWFCWVQNSGTGVITIDPAGAETIDGQATDTLLSGQFLRIVSDGSNFFTMDSQPRLTKLRPILGTQTGLRPAEGGDGIFGTTVSVGFNSARYAFGNGAYIAAPQGTFTNVSRSTDLATWNSAGLPLSREWFIGGSDTGFLAYCANAQDVATSTNGAAWSAATSLPFSASAQPMLPIRLGSLWVVLSGFGSTNYATSTDNGATWTARILPASPTNTAGHGLFQLNSTTLFLRTGATTAYTTTDGINWTLRTCPNSARIDAQADNSLIAFMGNNAFYQRTTDGITWTELPLRPANTNAPGLLTIGTTRFHGQNTQAAVPRFFTSHNDSQWVERIVTNGWNGVTTDALGQMSPFAAARRGVFNNRVGLAANSVDANFVSILDGDTAGTSLFIQA